MTDSVCAQGCLKLSVYSNFSVIYCKRRFDSRAISHQNMLDRKRFTVDSARARPRENGMGGTCTY